MSCRPVSSSDLKKIRPDLLESHSLIHSEGEKRSGPDVYLCDKADELPRMAFASPPLLATLPLKAPRVTPIRSLPPPPSSPLARMLYDFTTQLEDFHLKTTIKIPVEGLNRSGPIDTFTSAVLGNQGALVALGMEFKPAWGPLPIVPTLDHVPIIAPFFQIRVLKLEMEPETRRIRARLCYLVVPFNQDVHDLFLEKSDLDLPMGLPFFSWQFLDLFLKAVEEKGEGIADVKPRLDQGEIGMEGNFSNRSVDVAGMQLHFAPLPSGQSHRIRVSGCLLEPTVTVHGLESVKLGHPKADMRVSNKGSTLDPLTMKVKIDPTFRSSPTFEIPRFRSDRVLFEAVPVDASQLPLRMELEEGIDVQGVTMRIDPSGPRIGIRKMVAKKVAFDGGGVRLRTGAGDETIFEDVKVAIEEGRPSFRSRIRATANGEANYFMKDERLGTMQFRFLESEGNLRIERTQEGPEVEITGHLKTEMPKIDLIVRSENLQAFVDHKIEDATVEGTGRVLIRPERREALIEGKEGEGMRVKGKGGTVRFHQSPSQVEEWPELRRELGGKSDKIQSDLTIAVKEVGFEVQRMRFESLVHSGGQAALEIQEADIGSIDVTGDLSGLIFVRIPGGFYRPVRIHDMPDAFVRIGQLKDRTSSNGRREADFSKVLISGVESRPHFSRRDQKRCGVDRQHIHATLGFFQFSPDDRRIVIDQVDPHFHTILEDLEWGGCLKIE